MGCMYRRELPGHETIKAGLADLESGIGTLAGLLVMIGRPRLDRLGFELPAGEEPDPEKRLYELLVLENPATAYSRHNALIRLLVSYERAAECLR